MKKELSPFTRAVINAIKKIPAGRVATYGQIAKLAGNPGGARGVVWILHSCSEAYRLPWHRVVNAHGVIALPADKKNHQQQRQLLKNEGVEFTETSRVDLKKHQWGRQAPLQNKSSSKNRPKIFG